MNKKQIEETVIQNGKERLLSAQDYEKLSAKEKGFVREVLATKGMDADDYERHMKKLWPKKVILPTPVWRNR